MRSHWLLAFLLFVPFTASAEDLGYVGVNLSAPNSLANTHGKGPLCADKPDQLLQS